MGLMLAILWWPTWPIHLAGRTAMLLDPWTRYYFSPTRDAALAVRSGLDGWLVVEHVCKRPGLGLGAKLRAAIAPGLIAAADAKGIRLYAVTRSQKLGERYAREHIGQGVTLLGRQGRYLLERMSMTGESQALIP